MDFSFFSGALVQWDADVVVFVAFEDESEWPEYLGEVDRAVGGLLSEVAREQGFKGKADSSVVLHTHGRVAPRRLAIIGGGKRAELTRGSVRSLAARAARLADGLRLRSVGFVAPSPVESDADTAARFVAEGALLGLYRFDRYRSSDSEPPTVRRFGLALATGGTIEPVDADRGGRAAEVARVVAGAIKLARDMVNEPPQVMLPRRIAEIALEVAHDEGLEIQVFDKQQIQERQMELLLAVSAGSAEEPRFIHMTYRPEGSTEGLPEIALVGKGITFDSGGYNLKPVGAIEDMKIDMAGAAVVIGVMKAIRAFRPRVIVHGIIPSSENLISGSAYKLGDIYRGRNGKTVEIRNTDAEGRLILADALTYAVEVGAAEIISLATLTGACVVALGPYTSGVMGSRQPLVDALLDAARSAGEDMWQLPLNRKLRRMLKSDVADMKNVGERWGGAITAALFLEEFVDDRAWVHVDLAGPSYIEQQVEDYVPKGASGHGILTLLEFLSQHS